MTDEHTDQTVLERAPRRTFLGLVAGSGVAAGLAGVVQEQDVKETIEFEGHYTEWHAEAPEAITIGV